ncbi:high mobility group box domain-containing protein, partial [Leucosporidium creatinivorum]
RSIGHITRPRNAFILFRSHAVSTNLIPRDLGIKNEKNISQVVATVWRSLPPEEKRHWELLAEEEKRAHKEKYPEYVFKPKQ